MIEGSELYQRWLYARVGKCTASRIRDVVATIKSGGYGAGRERYRSELIVERQTGQPYELVASTFKSAAMKRGNEMQPVAEAAYGLFIGETVILPEELWQYGFAQHSRIEGAGASPDGGIGKDGLIEIKCPDTHTHLATARGRTIAVEYYDQMQFQLACTGRQWVDWVSFDNRVRPALQLFRRRIIRDDKRIAELEREAELFLAEVAAECAALDRLSPDDMIYAQPREKAA
jgi:hypothetical protein